MSIEFAALLVSLVSIGLTIWQGIMTREHNRLSVKPHIVARESNDWSDAGYRYKYVLSNTGLGPAIVRELTIKVDGEKVIAADPVKATVKRLLDGKAKYQIKAWSFPASGYCLKPGEDYLLADIFFPGMTPEMGDAIQIPEKSVRMDFESMYGVPGVFSSVKEKPTMSLAAAPAMTVTHPAAGK